MVRGLFECVGGGVMVVLRGGGLAVCHHHAPHCSNVYVVQVE